VFNQVAVSGIGERLDRNDQFNKIQPNDSQEPHLSSIFA